jgi:hypothetical protein
MKLQRLNRQLRIYSAGFTVNLSEEWTGKCGVATKFSYWTGATMAVNFNRLASADGTGYEL